MIAALLLDMDGLMVDTEQIYWAVARELAQLHGVSVTDATLRRMMGRGRLEAMRVFAADCGVCGATPEALLEERERRMLQQYGRGVSPMPGLIEILEHFRGRLRLAVVTSSPRRFTDVLLPALGVERYFDAVQTGDEIERGKPHPEIYLRAIARLGVEAPECIVLEDSRAGALAGRRAGAIVLAVPSALTRTEDFSFADGAVTSLHAAIDWIEARIATQTAT